jgi:hypothetical protein
MCEAAQQLARARHLLDLMRGNGIYNIPQLVATLTQKPCEHETRSNT